MLAAFLSRTNTALLIIGGLLSSSVVLTHLFLKGLAWENVPFHATVEAVGGFSALGLAWTLLAG